MYCTYLTVYSGTKLPPYYIGSTTIANVKSGYKGSVTSKKYGSAWKSELKKNPQLFHTLILSEHKKRDKAYESELKFQKYHDVVKSSMFVNQAFAYLTSGCYSGLSGEDHHMFGVKIRRDKHYRFSGYYHTPFGRLESKRHIREHTDKISASSVFSWCMNSEKIIVDRSFFRSKYITRDMIGKTYKEIGFWFEPV